MKRCPCCNTSMIIEEQTSAQTAVTACARVWKCLGCGREFPYPTQQTNQEQSKPRSW